MTSAGLVYRLGAELRPASTPLPNSNPTHEFQVQIAAPPPPRTDGSAWYAGLRVDDGSGDGQPFDLGDSHWERAPVFPLQGISPLAEPDPATLIFDEPVFVVDRVTGASVNESFALIAPDKRTPDKVISFLSIFYPQLQHPETGVAVQDVAASFYREGTFTFSGTPTGFAAVSLHGFRPVDRGSAEYIFLIP